MRALTVILLAFLAVPLLADEAWVVVTLDRIEFQGNLVFWPRFVGNPIGFVSVVASGNTYQKLVWPAAGWYTIADEGKELVQETEGIPFFALPLSQMGSRLGIALQFLVGEIELEWGHSGIPEIISDLEKRLRREFAARIITPSLPGSRVKGPQEPSDTLYFSPYIQVFGPDAWEGKDVRSYNAEVKTGANVIRLQYSIRRVYLPQGLRARLRLEGIKAMESGDTMKGEIFIQARTMWGFAPSGAPLQRVLRIPSSGHYSMGDGDEKVLSVVLFEGEVRPFLYAEIMVWDEDNPEIGDQHDLLGGFFGLWLPWRLSNLPGGEKRLIVPKSTPDGEVLIYLRLQLLD